MVTNVLKKVFGTRNDRELKRMGKVVKQINAFEEAMQALTDEQLAEMLAQYKKRHSISRGWLMQ